MYLFIFCSLFSSSLLLAVCIFHCLFFREDYQHAGWGGAGQDKRGRRQKRGIRRGGGATGVCYVVFCSLLYSIVPLTLLLLRGTGQRGRRARTGGRRTGWRPEEDGGQMRGAGLSRGLRRAVSRSGGLRRVGDGGGRGGRETRSGRRLDNIAVVLPPPWLRDMLRTIRA